jgi:hypothetical protein
MTSYSPVSLKKSLSLIPTFAWRTRPKSVELIAKGIKVKPFLFALLTGLGLFYFEVSKAQAQTVRRPQNCGPKEAVVARLAKAYGEVRKSRAWEPITRLLRCLHPTNRVLDNHDYNAYLFSPGIWWIGFKMSRSGSDVQVLLMYS